jgi:hypothetical protein
MTTVLDESPVMTLNFECGFEEGNFSALDNVAVSGLTNHFVQSEIVHSGRFAAKLTVMPFWFLPQPGIRLVWYNKAIAAPEEAKNVPDEAYYSAWYYLPPVETLWLNIMQWKQGHQTSPTRQAREPVAFVKLKGSSNQMTLELQHRVSAEGTYLPGSNMLAERPDVPVPVNEWFELTSFYRWDKGHAGRIATWLNGQSLWDVEGIQTEYDQPYLEYPREATFNNYAASVKSERYGLYIDDIRVWTA